MIEQVPFVKYTAHGNNFVILDETKRTLLSENEKRKFAWHATNCNFGIGCDNLLIIENADPEKLNQINRYGNYWTKAPDIQAAKYIFRMFEPDGSEAHSCGNGLMCIADYLYQKYGVRSTRILTRIPSMNPMVVEIGRAGDQSGAWVNLGKPEKPSENFVSDKGVYSITDTILGLNQVSIRIRTNDFKPYTNQRQLRISGYIVFTGEPHLVIFADSGLSISEFKDMIFIPPGTSLNIEGREEKRYTFGGWLLRQIGLYLNQHRRDLFPKGINVNIARILRNGATVLEYRSFERGINKETLSCGTGAVAAAFIASRLNLVSSNCFDVWPHMARWYERNMRLRVMETEAGWYLNSVPVSVFQGNYRRASTGSIDEHAHGRMVKPMFEDPQLIPLPLPF